MNDIYIYLVATRTDPCETIIQGPKWQLVSNSSDLLFGDVDPYLLSTHLSTTGFKSPYPRERLEMEHFSNHRVVKGKMLLTTYLTSITL